MRLESILPSDAAGAATGEGAKQQLEAGANDRDANASAASRAGAAAAEEQHCAELGQQDRLTSGLRISASLHAGGVSGGVDGDGDPRGERVVRTADATLLVAARDGPGEALEVALAPCLNRSH